MLPDIGGTELLVIAAVALIVVGPKDLPVLLRKLGQFVARIRGMANEFRASFDEMARQSELDELRREVQAMREGQYTAPMRDAAAEASDAAHVDQVFAEIDAGLNSGAVKAAPYEAYPGPAETFEAPSPSPSVEIAAKPARKTASKPRAATASKPAKPAVGQAESIAKPAAKPAAKRAPKGEPSDPAKPARKRPAKAAATNSDITS